MKKKIFIIPVTVTVITIIAGILQSGYAETKTKRAVAPDAIVKVLPNSAIKYTEMIFVEGGTFTMGCTPEQGDDCLDSEKPAHQVTVGDFYIGKYEVTQKLWKSVMGDDYSYNLSRFKGDDLPVENVSWNMVHSFIRKLNEKTGKRYRLPTEAEWEYAARGGNLSKGYKYAGSNNIDDVAFYCENSGDSVLKDSCWSIAKLNDNNNRTHPVGTKKPNELGIHDMSGNVSEWVDDYHFYTADPNVIRTTIRGRVSRGGCWQYRARYCRVSIRMFDYSYPTTLSDIKGFRLALSP